MGSLFQNLLGVISSDRIPLEDFFTEIFAYLLKSKPEILEGVLQAFSLSKMESWQNTFVTTQETFFALNHHSVDSRPDIQIELSTSKIKEILLIECKIDAVEGNDQLKRYAEHLDKIQNLHNGILLYITRDYDPKNRNKIFRDCQNRHKLHFTQVRWYEVYNLLKTWDDDFFVQELLTFMETSNMAFSNQFNAIDLLALTNFPRMQKMMDEALGGVVRERLKKVLKHVSQTSVSMTEFRKHNRYIVMSQQKDYFWCGLGFWVEPSNPANYPKIGVQIEIPPNHTNRSEVLEMMKEVVRQGKWEGRALSEAKAWSGIFQRRSLQQFLSEEEHIKSIQNQFLCWIDEIRELKENYPTLPWK